MDPKQKSQSKNNILRNVVLPADAVDCVDGQSKKRGGAGKVWSSEADVPRYDRGGQETVRRGKEGGRTMQIGSKWKNRRKSYQGKKKIDADG